jgi:acyl-CoA thioester hydrolase
MAMSEKDLLLEQVLKLPRVSEQEIPADYLDANGHMNMMYYTLVANMGLGKFFENIRARWDVMRERKRSFFAMKQVLSYLHELREGERVAIHAALYNFDNKRLHFIIYTVSLDYNWVSCVDERMSMYIDMTQRRSAEFEPEFIERLTRVRDEYHATGWVPELSGAIQLKPRS